MPFCCEFAFIIMYALFGVKFPTWKPVQVTILTFRKYDSIVHPKVVIIAVLYCIEFLIVLHYQSDTNAIKYNYNSWREASLQQDILSLVLTSLIKPKLSVSTRKPIISPKNELSQADISCQKLTSTVISCHLANPA